MNLVDALAGGDVLKWDSVMYTTYSDIYLKLLMNKETTLFNRRMHKNAMQEMKSKRR